MVDKKDMENGNENGQPQERKFEPITINGFEANVILPKMLKAYAQQETDPKARNDAIRSVLRKTTNKNVMIEVGAFLTATPTPENEKINCWQSYDAENQAYRQKKQDERDVGQKGK